MEDKKISGVEPPKAIAETPPSTPIPQASSTAAHRPEESLAEITIVEEQDYETRLSDIIGGLRFLGDKLQDRESQISQRQPLISNERAIARSKSLSSIGILKFDETQSLPGDTLDEDIHNLIQNFEAALATANKKSEEICEENPACVSEKQADMSDLAIDLRVRLQKELAQRTMERFSLPETLRSKHSSISEGNKSFQEGCTIASETYVVSKGPEELSCKSEQDLAKPAEDASDPYLYLNEAKCSSSFLTKDKMALAEYADASFVPGEQFKELLAQDEEAWSKENIPPVADPPAKLSTSDLEFSGIAANAEISLPNVSKYIGNLDSKISIGQYFKLKSEDPTTLTERCSVIFTKKEKRVKDKKDRETMSTTLSLSQIAGILGKLDSAMSPRTLVADFLKQATSAKNRSSLSESLASLSEKDRSYYLSILEGENPRDMFEVPRKSEGLGSVSYSTTVNSSSQKNTVPPGQKTITIEDSLAAGDLSMLKLDETVDESVVCLTKELVSRPGESVDCSALLPTLRKHCPDICGYEPEFEEARTPADLETPKKHRGLAWAAITLMETPPVACVGVESNAQLPVQNLTERWLICGLSLDYVKQPGGEPDEGDNLAIVKIPPKTVLMDPNNIKVAKVDIVPVCEGLVEIGLQLNFEDVVTKATQRLQFAVTILGEEPNLTFKTSKSFKIIEERKCDHLVMEYGLLPEECMDQFKFTLFNGGDAAVPLQLSTHTQSPSGVELFFLVAESSIDYDDYEESLISGRTLDVKFQLEPRGQYTVVVLCATPSMSLFPEAEKEGFCDIAVSLTITLLSVKALNLQKIEFLGQFGITRFAVQLNSQPIKMISTGLGRSNKQYLPVKNYGLVPYKVYTYIMNEEYQVMPEDDFTAEPSKFMLEPGDIANVTITYTPSTLQTLPSHRELLIQMHPLGPRYYIDLVGTLEKCSTERKAISPVQLHNKIQSLNDSLNTASDKSRELKPTVKQSLKADDRAVSGSPLLSRSHISQGTRRSSSSNSDSAQCEKLCIQSTRRELVWGSVDVGKNVMKQCTIRSLAEHRCRMQISVTDKNNVYKLMNEKGELVTQRKTMLHTNENLVVNVMFNPSKAGPLPAKLTFTHVPGHSEDTSSVHIPLYACGGHARLVVKGIPRDGAGRMWLTMQQQDAGEELFWESIFSVRNTGDLPAFLKVRVASKGFHHVNESSFIVEPSELVIAKGSVENINVCCRPRPQDLKLLLSGHSQDVIEVATINLISGDEPTRHRLRRLHKKMMKENAMQKEKKAEIDLAAISAPFPGEKGIPKIDSLRESLDSVHELYHSISLQEVIVLLENNNDRTIQEGDTSRVFHSLHEVDISRTRIEDATCYNVQEETLFADIAKSPTKCTWHIDPTSLIIAPPLNICATFRLKTDSSRKQPFEICIPTHPPGWVLSVNPSTGFIPAADELILVVSCAPSNESSPTRPMSWKGSVQVFIENDLKEVAVSMQNNQKPKQDLRSASQPKNKLAVASSKTDNRPATTPSQTGTIRKTNLLQKPSVQTQKRSPNKLSKIPVPSVTLAPIVGGYLAPDWTVKEELQNYKAHLERPDASFMPQTTSKNFKKSPNPKR